jgi:hypothetical protein
MVTKLARPPLLTVVALASLAMVATAQTAGSGTAIEIEWRVTDGGAAVPERVSTGYAVMTLTADGETTDTLVLYRLRPGHTVAELEAASAAIDRASHDGRDVTGHVNAALEIADMVAELQTGPGDRKRVGVMLVEGSYVLELGRPRLHDTPLRTYRLLAVAGEGRARPPLADVEIRLVDFSVSIPQVLASGTWVWHVVNEGRQIHHLVVIRLDARMTVDDLTAWFEAPAGASPPGYPIAAIGVHGAAEEGYHTVFLPPGEYVAVCFLPDHHGASGSRHFELGMLQAFGVVRAE